MFLLRLHIKPPSFPRFHRQIIQIHMADERPLIQHLAILNVVWRSLPAENRGELLLVIRLIRRSGWTRWDIHDGCILITIVNGIDSVAHLYAYQ